MSNNSKFWRLAALVPQVQCPDQPIPFRQKVVYTTSVLAIFLVASQLPLYGINHRPRTIEPDPLHWMYLIVAANRNTLLTHGILAILAPEVLMNFVVVTKTIILDTSTPETRILMSRAQKLLGILITILGAVSFYVQSYHFTVNTVLVMLQILCSGIIVIYLDDVLKKGYGLLSGTSLFTATSSCGNILWKALSPMSIIYPGKGAEFEGAVVAWVHLLITRTDKLSAMSKAFYRQNLPNITSFLATCGFVPLAILFQGFYITLPVRTGSIFQAECRIKLSNFLYGPIVLHHFFVPLPYFISKVLYMKYNGNILVNLLGPWNRSNHFGQSIPTGGIAYYLTTPPTFVDLHRDPLHAFIYVSFVLISCVILSEWVILCAPVKGIYNGFVVLKEERRLRVAQPDSIHVNEILSYVRKAACVGGFLAGALIIFADLIGVLGTGTGVMLAVTALYPYFDGRASEVGSFGY
uniref:Translocon Sec61/SecY plug domain-containing protein n=1 Tax=Leersia perrieri TaxID=77586 RepID=A0A0D9Y195_9ORYZ